MPASNSHWDDYPTVTVEAKYSHPGSDKGVVHQWTFHDRTPQRAYDLVIKNYGPRGATLWWVGLWTGTPDDRPEGGYETGILEDDEAK